MAIVVAMQIEIIAAMIPMDMPAIAPVENELPLPALKKRVHSHNNYTRAIKQQAGSLSLF